MNSLETIFHAFIETSWRTSCLIAFVLGLRRLLQGRVAARVLSWVWIAVAVRLLIPVSLPAAWSPFNLVAGATAPVHGALAFTLPAVTPLQDGLNIERAVGTAGSDAFVAARPALTMGEWAALIWTIGVTGLLLMRGLAWVRFARKLRRSIALPSEATATLLADASRPLDMRGVSVQITDAVTGPGLYGIVRPRILFPPGFVERLTPAELRLTLEHELAHVRRRDLLADTLLHVAVVLHWFNPLVWLVVRAAKQDCEVACDETVLRRLSETECERYGATLLSIARLSTVARGSAFTLGVVASRNQIKRRIQMIVENRTFTPGGMLASGALFAALTGLSFTSELVAQATLQSGVPSAPSSASVAAQSSATGIVYHPSVDRLDALFPTGVVATVADRSITVADVRSYIAPLIPKLQQDSSTQEDFNRKLTLLQNSAVKDLVARGLLIRQFHDQREGEPAKEISAPIVDKAIADTITERFGGDRSKFLEHLKERGLTQRDYRKQIEEDIIYNYMRGQERKASAPVSQSRIEAAAERPIRLRLIQLTRAAGETDASLLEKANAILARFRSGERFADLAREFDQSKKRDAGGDWGWMGAADLRAEYRDAFVALKKGDVSAPILAKEGCFLLYAEDQR